MEPWAAAKKGFKLLWRCHQLLSGFLAKGHLARVSRPVNIKIFTADIKKATKIIRMISVEMSHYKLLLITYKHFNKTRPIPTNL